LKTALALSIAGALATAALAQGSEIYISPVRADLRAGALSETISITNRGATPLRVAVKLMEWTQDAQGQDVLRDSSELVYFPRQMEIEPQGKRLVRVGAKSAPAGVERAFRLYIEEQPEPAAQAAPAKVSVYFRFGVPVFLLPSNARPEAEIGEPTLDKGRLSLQVKNEGNQHIRIQKVRVDDGAGFTREAAGWYTLAGTQRTYTFEIPREVCRQAKVLSVGVEGEGVRADRKLNVDPARCS
jgi:fimbrial chaperone protein